MTTVEATIHPIMGPFIDMRSTTIHETTNHPTFHTLPKLTNDLLPNYISLMICPTATIHQTTFQPAFHLNNTTLLITTRFDHQRSKDTKLTSQLFSIQNRDNPLISPNSTSHSETTKTKPLHNFSIQTSESNLKTNKPIKFHHNQNSLLST